MPGLHLVDRSQHAPPLSEECHQGLVSDLFASPSDAGGRLRLDLDRPFGELAEQFVEWAEQRRLPWLHVCGQVAAPVLQIVARRLDLRLGGAVLVAPAGWRQRGAVMALPLAPLAFPALLVRTGAGRHISAAAARRLALAWGIEEHLVVDQLASAQAAQDPILRRLMQRRATALQRAGIQLSLRLN